MLEEVAATKAIYGMNRQFGPFCKESISDHDISEFQIEMVLGHAVKSGEKLSSEVVRAMMLSRINGFARGTAGISLNVVELLITMLNMKIHSVVFAGCSVGQSDLSEMAQIASAIIGQGQVEYQGRTRPAREIFALLGLPVGTLKGKEALALISSNGLTLGRGALACKKALEPMDLFNLAAAMALEGFGANLSMLHPAASKAKAHTGYLASSI